VADTVSRLFLRRAPRPPHGGDPQP
jgi:hypothetical protein